MALQRKTSWGMEEEVKVKRNNEITRLGLKEVSF